MRIVLISDTHTLHNSLVIPQGDMLCHIGDGTHEGSYREAADVLRWMSKFSHPYKVYVPGNHDAIFEIPEYLEQLRYAFPSIHILVHQESWYKGFRIFGSPYCVWHNDWSFMEASLERRHQYWLDIPDDTDILLTHSPAWGTLDKNDKGERCGCQALDYRISKLSHLKLHAAGHIHASSGIEKRGNLICVNASIVGNQNGKLNPVRIIDLADKQ